MKQSIVPKNVEVQLTDYIALIKQFNIQSQKQLNDIKVYSNVVKKILAIPLRSFSGNYYIPMDAVTQICNQEFKHLSKNWKVE